MEKMGGTLNVQGHIVYQGSRDELNLKLRQRDDEIDRLRYELETIRRDLAALADKAGRARYNLAEQ